MIEVSLAHLLLVAVSIAVTWKVFRVRPSLLALNLLGFLSLCSLGLSFAPYLPLDKIPYLLDTPGGLPVICQQNPEIYVKHVLGHWCFLVFPLVVVIRRLSTKRPCNVTYSNAPAGASSSLRLIQIVILLLGISLLLSVKYYLFGPGLEILKSSRLIFQSAADAVDSRSIGKTMLDVGQGEYMAQVAAQLIMPLTAVLAVQHRWFLRWPVFFMCLFGALTYGFQTRQKAPVVLTVILFGLVIIVSITSEKRLAQVIRSTRMILVFLMGMFAVSALSYVVNFGQSVGAGILSALARLLIVPCASEANYFAVFPNDYSFRGLAGVFSIKLGQWGATSDVTIYDVAVAATGNQYSANASVMAIAWSGAGYFGVLLVSIIITLLSCYLDRHLSRMSIKTAAIAVVLSLPSISGLVSGAFLDFVSRGGILLPALFLVILGITHRTRKRRLAVLSDERVQSASTE